MYVCLFLILFIGNCLSTLYSKSQNGKKIFILFKPKINVIIICISFEMWKNYYFQKADFYFKITPFIRVKGLDQEMDIVERQFQQFSNSSEEEEYLTLKG